MTKGSSLNTSSSLITESDWSVEDLACVVSQRLFNLFLEISSNNNYNNIIITNNYNNIPFHTNVPKYALINCVGGSSGPNVCEERIHVLTIINYQTHWRGYMY